MAVFSMAGSNPALPTYPLQRSVRLRSSASAYFNRTPASASNRQTWTWSAWVKRGTLGVTGMLFSTPYASAGNNSTYIQFAGDILVFTSATSSTDQIALQTSQVFRDPSAWYHIVVVADTTNATSTERARIYINGVRVTAFSVATYPAQNTNTYVNTATIHQIGRIVVDGSSFSQYFDGYLEEINFIDGQALTPSSFGAYNSYGVWSPAKYTGSYGTNGFYLNFQDNATLTTTVNVGIGADSSGNGNYWTSNNISLTAGVTYDSMLDVPTNTSTTNANYCTGNPLDNATTLTNGNLTVSATTNTGVTGTIAMSGSGLFYWETTVTTVAPSGNTIVGILATNQAAGVRNVTVGGIRAYARSDGLIIIDLTTVQSGLTAFSNGDVIGCAYNATTNSLQFYRNNSTYGTAVTPTSGYTYVPWCASAGTSVFNWNFGQRPFTYTPPTGFNRLNTYNLPDSIVPVGAQYMAATTYTSTGTTQSLTNTVNGTSMQPDLVWQKVRSVAGDNYLIDSVRGASNVLISNTTAAAASSPTFLTSFNSNGWTQGSGNYTAGVTVVGWQWRASNASAVTNTAGTISSQVSANQTAGFSIVTYTGTGANATVGHGLGVAPRMMIIKRRNSTSNWPVYHASISGSPDNFLYLNSTSAVINAGVVFNGVTPNSTTFGVGTDAIVNASGGTYVGYMFAAVPGYSAFGSYTGNGSADGPFVYCGFRPRWVMVKSTGVDGWVILDTSRDTYNLALAQLIPNLANAEDTTNNYFRCDILSNGFKLRTASSPSNSNAVNYIYAAFAENPFKNSLAR